jgi:hypothetical protein
MTGTTSAGSLDAASTSCTRLRSRRSQCGSRKPRRGGRAPAGRLTTSRCQIALSPQTGASDGDAAVARHASPIFALTQFFASWLRTRIVANHDGVAHGRSSRTAVRITCTCLNGAGSPPCVDGSLWRIHAQHRTSSPRVVPVTLLLRRSTLAPEPLQRIETSEGGCAVRCLRWLVRRPAHRTRQE